jgi:RNA polymerase sigma factor (TIGR02999 family)
MSSGEVTLLLRQWREGDPAAFDSLLPLVYNQLRAIADSYLRRERPGHTLQATALVNELYLKLVNQRKAEWNDREHFLTFAARLMRMMLIDHARGLHRERRGNGTQKVPLHEEMAWLDARGEEMLSLEQALRDLELLDKNKLRAVELRYFLGCTAEETAEIMGSSKATIDRELRFARNWLYAKLHTEAQPPSA